MTSSVFAFHVFGLIKINYQGNKKISQQKSSGPDASLVNSSKILKI